MENWYSDYPVAREGLSNEVTFQQSLEGIALQGHEEAF